MATKKAAATATKQEPPEREIPEGEAAQVRELLAKIERAKTLVKTFNETTLPELRRYLWGTKKFQGDNEGATVRTNMIFATQAALLPFIYAKNPEIAVAPSESVDQKQRDAVKEFCTTAQVMLNRVLVEEAGLKKRAKSNVRSAMNTAVGWLKLTFQKSLQGDPIILKRVNDLQDNIAKIEHLTEKQKTEADPDQLAKNRDEMKQQLATIMEGDEVSWFKGFALDRIQTEDMLILDESVVDFDDYVNAARLAHGVWMTEGHYEQQFGHKPYTGTTKFGQPATEAMKDETGNPVPFGEGSAKVQYVRVWEVWDKKAGNVKTVTEGSKGYCRPPYKPDTVPDRFYPFFCLGFNLVEGRWRPLSDVELLKQLQEEYNTTRHLFAETRKEAIPNIFFRKGGNLSEEDIKAITHRKPRQTIGIEGNPAEALDHDIMRLAQPPIDPALFDISIIRNDMDMMVGLSDASRSNLIEAKTATEAEIMRQSLMNRVAERQDTNEDLITDMAKAAMEVMLAEFAIDEVQEIAGPEAVWPEFDAKEIFRKVNVSVRAGSTGKPNVEKEREAWAVIMPIIKDTMAQVAELRMSGQFDMADALIELLKETFKRYDERLDVDRFIPEPELGDDGQPVQATNAIAQAQQVQEQAVKQAEELKAAQERILQLEHELMNAKQNEQAKIADAGAKQAIATAQESSKQAEAAAKMATADADAQAKYAAEIEKATIAANADKEKERMRLDAQKEIEAARNDSAERIARINAGAKLRAAKGKKPGESEGAEVEEPETDKEYEAIAGVLQQQGEALTTMAQAIEKLANAQSSTRELTVTTPDGRVLKGRSNPMKLVS